MFSSFFRWANNKEMARDLKIIKDLPKDAYEVLHETITTEMIRIEVRESIPVREILHSTSYHATEGSEWAKSVIIINLHYRQPAIRKAKAGDSTAMAMQLSYAVILHSIRAILDFEQSGNKELMNYCQSMWYYLADGDFSKIPSRFQRRGEK